MPQILQFIMALVVIIALALLVSNDRKKSACVTSFSCW